MRKIFNRQLALAMGASIGLAGLIYESRVLYEARVEARVEAATSTFSIKNDTEASTIVYLSFGADSALKADDIKLCKTKSGSLNCNFTLVSSSTISQRISKYLNVTVSFGSQGCGATKAELNMNNPKWYDTYDVSLVDGYSNKVSITIDKGGTKTLLGPPLGKDGNEKVYGLFPYGCDICVSRQKPPCGISPGSSGCKTGNQYKPDVICQLQGPKMGGGGVTATVALNP